MVPITLTTSPTYDPGCCNKPNSSRSNRTEKRLAAASLRMRDQLASRVVVVSLCFQSSQNRLPLNDLKLHALDLVVKETIQRHGDLAMWYRWRGSSTGGKQGVKNLMVFVELKGCKMLTLKLPRHAPSSPGTPSDTQPVLGGCHHVIVQEPCLSINNCSKAALMTSRLMSMSSSSLMYCVSWTFAYTVQHVTSLHLQLKLIFSGKRVNCKVTQQPTRPGRSLDDFLKRHRPHADNSSTTASCREVHHLLAWSVMLTFF